MAMPRALAHYWANKRGGRRRARSSHPYKSHSSIVKYRTRYVTKHKSHGRRRGRAYAAGLLGAASAAGGLVPVVALAAALGYADGNISEFSDLLKKVPGTKTFGAPLIVGGLALGINEFIYPNKWLRLVGALGLLVGAFQLGRKKFAVAWVGDVADADGFAADVD